MIMKFRENEGLLISKIPKKAVFLENFPILLPMLFFQKWRFLKPSWSQKALFLENFLILLPLLFDYIQIFIYMLRYIYELSNGFFENTVNSPWYENFLMSYQGEFPIKIQYHLGGLLLYQIFDHHKRVYLQTITAYFIQVSRNL